MGIIVGVNLCETEGKEYIEIDVPSYPIGISCKGIYYFRSGSTRQVLTGPALEAFLMRKRGATWDNLPLPAFSLDHVDDAIVELVYLKYMKAKITYEGMQRIERYFVPEDALREALLNALCITQTIPIRCPHSNQRI